jgi:signal transduction histidine kinase
MSLRVRMLGLLLVAVLPSFAVLGWGELRQRDEDVAQVQGELKRSAVATAALLRNTIECSHQLLVLLSRIDAIRNRDRAATTRLLHSLLAEDGDYMNFGAVFGDGSYVASAVPLPSPPPNANERSWFKRAISARSFVLGDYQIGLITKQPSIACALPMFSASGEIEQVLYSSLGLARIQRDCEALPVPDRATVLVVDANGTVLARRPDPEPWVGKRMSEAASVQAILERREGVAEVAGIDGVTRIHAFSPAIEYGGGAIYVGVAITREAAVAPAQHDFARMFTLLVVATLTMTATTWLVTDRALLGRVRRITSATRRLTAGEQGARIGDSGPNDELGELARAFDEMAGALQARLAERMHAEEQVLQLNRELEERVADRTGQLAAMNKELEAFSYSVSHDLRAPLRHINGFVNLLRQNGSAHTDDKSRHYMDTIQAASSRMGVLIDDILAFSRAGRSELHRGPVDLGAIASAAWKAAAVEAPGRDVKFVLGALPTVEGDSAMLHQVFVNLFSNALKFTRPRTRTVVEVGTEPAGDGEVQIYVRDNGVGFDMQYIDKLFGVFQRLHDSDSFEGTGIGLAIVQRVVHRHGGRIRAESTQGGGATFHFTLPVHPPKP